MKRISLYLLIFTMLYCLCACGKNSDAKSNSREDDGRKEQKIIISSIQVASNTKVMRAKVFLPNVKSLEGTNYWLGGLDTTSKVDVIDTGDGLSLIHILVVRMRHLHCRIPLTTAKRRPKTVQSLPYPPICRISPTQRLKRMQMEPTISITVILMKQKIYLVIR